MSGGSDIVVEGDDPKEWRFRDDFWFNVTFIYRCTSSATNEDAPGQIKDDDDDSSESGVEKNGRVYLAGDFNGWSTTKHQMRPCPEGYTITIPLSEGFYHYKFYAFGEWLQDLHNPHRGGCHDNSIMFVHMDPGVYGLRPQHPPHRDYHRPGADGSQFQVLCPPVPPDISSLGVLQRLIFVYLPPSYSVETARRFPVVYAHDGQNLFSTPEHRGGPCRGGWYLDAKLDHFWSQGELPEFILVAIPNSDFVCIGNRTREYCTSEFEDTTSDPYIRFLTEVVKKEIDSKFRTLSDAQHTVTLGASMGGLCAFVLALTRPQMFSRAICMSPSFWYADQNNSSAYTLVEKTATLNQRPPCKVFIDSGDGEGDNKYETKMMEKMLEKSGWSRGAEFEYFLDECAGRVDLGITHSESVWRERVDRGLKFVLS